MYHILLGNSGNRFKGHKGFLLKSPRFAREISRAGNKARKAHQETLILDDHNPLAFEQMIGFLYSNHFDTLRAKDTEGRCKELLELMSLSKHFELPLLQKQVVSTFTKLRLLNRMTPSAFFDWAEDMYYEEMDRQAGPFKKYFVRIATQLLTAERDNAAEYGPDVTLAKSLEKIIYSGGAFGVEVFTALQKVCSFVTSSGLGLALTVQSAAVPKIERAVVKKEEVNHGTPMRGAAKHGTSVAAAFQEPSQADDQDMFGTYCSIHSLSDCSL